MKRLIDIDDSALTEARDILGTTTMKDTVNEALRRVVDSRRPPSGLWDWLDNHTDIGDPTVMAGAWDSVRPAEQA